MRHSSLFVVLVTVSAIAAGRAVAEDQAMLLPVDAAALEVLSDNKVFPFTVEVADTDDERARGLMFRTDLPKDRVMLFDFGTERSISMWMKNTPLPLDMVFAEADGDVVAVIRNTRPFSLEVLSVEKPVRYVVEFKAGVVAEFGINAGDKLRHPLIQAGQ
jgi:uncharacterized protein